MSKSKIRRSLLVLVFLMSLSGLAAVACGSDGGADSASTVIPRIFDPGRNLTIADLTAFGFKKSKTYDVEGLTNADAAYYGFWGLDPYDRQEYEVRFFSSHQEAIDSGTALADERLVPTKLKKETSSWPVGLKDARLCGGDKGAGPVSHGIQACTQAKYKDYFIYGNMIVLCAGSDASQSDKRCRALLSQL